MSEQASLRSGEIKPTEAESRIFEALEAIDSHWNFFEDYEQGKENLIHIIRELHLTQSPVVMERVEEILNPGAEE
jgi:hypothetical protein